MQSRVQIQPSRNVLEFEAYGNLGQGYIGFRLTSMLDGHFEYDGFALTETQYNHFVEKNMF